MTEHVIHRLLPATHGASVTAKLPDGQLHHLHLTADGWATIPQPGEPSRPVDVETILEFTTTIGDTLTTYQLLGPAHAVAAIYLFDEEG